MPVESFILGDIVWGAGKMTKGWHRSKGRTALYHSSSRVAILFYLYNVTSPLINVGVHHYDCVGSIRSRQSDADSLR
jgi:hypothetical protein